MNVFSDVEANTAIPAESLRQTSCVNNGQYDTPNVSCNDLQAVLPQEPAACNVSSATLVELLNNASRQQCADHESISLGTFLNTIIEKAHITGAQLIAAVIYIFRMKSRHYDCLSAPPRGTGLSSFDVNNARYVLCYELP